MSSVIDQTQTPLPSCLLRTRPLDQQLAQHVGWCLGATAKEDVLRCKVEQCSWTGRDVETAWLHVGVCELMAELGWYGQSSE